MATSHHDPAAIPAPAAGAHELGVELLPLATETPAEYLARLKALHARVGALIGAIEQRRPVLGPMPVRPPRAAVDRRTDVDADRRVGSDDRRVGLPEARSVPFDRRFGARERRSLPVERREDHIERRRDPKPWALDGTAAMWALQVTAWVAVAAIALVYGIGR
jgi:hypothetical protein